ncbi:LPS assembly lipoprotein LptE [Jiulongibacter sp. NS-SX5]|uniref:LPS assembly lipoprotein LptE n=1 Tax=Jiulongibacter sp. NS-SX5 TaxID=3463854 RepID=UPI0040590B24
MKNKSLNLLRGLQLISILILSPLLQSCGVYSFTGTSLSPDLETITIENFSMATAGGPANLSLNFNEELKEYYQRNTSLKLLPANADLYLAGAITRYEMTPVATTSGDKAAMNRLTIAVEVTFQNMQDENESFEKEFSFYQDFSQEQSLSEVEPSLVPKILEQLVLNIFNDTAAKW